MTDKVAMDLGVPFGEAASQGTLEAFAILAALKHWDHKLQGQRILLEADSTVALAVSRKLSSGSPSLNWVGAEIAMQGELLNLAEFILHHLPGKLNDAADWLSRQDRGDPTPGGLKGLDIKDIPTARLVNPVLPPPGLVPALWGKSASVNETFDNL